LFRVSRSRNPGLQDSRETLFSVLLKRHQRPNFSI
jgi:hypothetical protein